MPTTTTSSIYKSISFGVVAIAAAMMLVFSWLAIAVNASSIVQVTSNIADVPNGESLVLTVGTQNDGNVNELEVDHSLQNVLPEFSVYANEANPYGGTTCGPDNDVDCQTAFNTLGVTVTYSAASSQWVIDFGDDVTQDIRDNGGDINFYFLLRDAAGEILWGSMDLPTPDSTFTFDVVAGTGDELVPAPSDDADEEEAVIPGVPNTSLGQ